MIGQGGWVRAAVTTTAIYLIVELPTTESMAAPMPASTSSRMAGSRTRTLEVATTGRWRAEPLHLVQRPEPDEDAGGGQLI